MGMAGNKWSKVEYSSRNKEKGRIRPLCQKKNSVAGSGHPDRVIIRM
ncbi:hypothetical protein [Paenibacillus ferrarius]